MHADIRCVVRHRLRAAFKDDANRLTAPKFGLSFVDGNTASNALHIDHYTVLYVHHITDFHPHRFFCATTGF